VATQDVFSDEELAQLRDFPEINRAELIRYLTLTGADEAFVRRFRTGRNVLGVAVQLCTLPWLGFVPDELAAAPAAVVGQLSQRLGIAMGELRGHGEREQTRTDHLRDVAAYAGWRPMDTGEWKELDESLSAVHREVARVCKARGLPVPSRGALERRVARKADRDAAAVRRT
jgi:hypothetical protein